MWHKDLLTTKVFILFALLMFALQSVPTNTLGSDTPPGRWWRLPQAVETLSLDDSEIEDLDNLFVQSRRKLIKLKSNVEKERFELDNLLDSPRLDESLVMAQFKRLEKARADLAAERFRFLLGVRKILGFERYEQIKLWFKESRQEKRKGPKRRRDR